MVSLPRPLLSVLPIATLVCVAGCSSAPVTPQEPGRITAESSGRATADTAAASAREARPDDNASEKKQSRRWIYASNMEPGAKQPRDDTDNPAEPAPTAASSEQSSTTGETAGPPSDATDQLARTPVVKIIVDPSGQFRTPAKTFDSAADAAKWARAALDQSGTTTVEVYTAPETPFKPLDALLSALRNERVPNIYLVSAPATSDDAPSNDTNK